MNVGMLWLDTDQIRPLDEKVTRAAEYYQEKYGRTPEVCYVNTAMLKEETNVGRIEVKPIKSVHRHHFWIGMKN
jgi:hypothetical protein